MAPKFLIWLLVGLVGLGGLGAGAIILLPKLQPTTSPSSVAPLAEVPPPSAVDMINLFFRLLNEKRVTEAADLLAANLIPDESARKNWEDQFKIFEKAEVLSLEPYQPEEWHADRQVYQISLNVTLNSSGAQAPIPNYGWENGENLRWLIIKKEASGWRLEAIATGP